VQINFMNGYNVIVEKDDFKVGDVVVLELPEKKIMETFSLDKDVLIYLIGGKYVGRTGKVIEFDSKHITFESDNETQKTDRRYSFVIGKDKPIVNVE